MAKGKKGGVGGKNKPKASGKGSKKIKNQKTQTVAASSHRKPQQQQNQNQSKKNKKDADGLSSMQAEMRRRLDGGKFRMLNEQLYTSTGKEAFKTFQSDPVLFDVVRSFCLEVTSLGSSNSS